MNTRSTPLKSVKLAVTAIALLAAQVAFGEPVPTKQARENGVSTCLKKVDQLANFLLNDNNHTSNSTWATKQADKRMFNSELIVNYGDGASVAVMSVAPTSSGKCDASYSRVFAFKESCVSVRETTYKTWNFKGENAGVISLSQKENRVNALLLPVGSGCAAILAETVLD